MAKGICILMTLLWVQLGWAELYLDGPTQIRVTQGRSLQVEYRYGDSENARTSIRSHDLPEFISLQDSKNGSAQLRVTTVFAEVGVYTFMLTVLGPDGNDLFQVVQLEID